MSLIEPSCQGGKLLRSTCEAVLAWIVVPSCTAVSASRSAWTVAAAGPSQIRRKIAGFRAPATARVLTRRKGVTTENVIVLARAKLQQERDVRGNSRARQQIILG